MNVEKQPENVETVRQPVPTEWKLAVTVLAVVVLAIVGFVTARPGVEKTTTIAPISKVDEKLAASCRQPKSESGEKLVALTGKSLELCDIVSWQPSYRIEFEDGSSSDVPDGFEIAIDCRTQQEDAVTCLEGEQESWDLWQQAEYSQK